MKHVVGSYLAAVDMGTNSFHMIIVEWQESGSFRVVDRLKQWVRLGDGVDKKGQLTKAAIARMCDCLQQFKQLADSYQADLHCVATSAIRDAKNQKAILRRLRHELGVHVHVVSGAEEGRLVFQGVRSAGYIHQASVMVVDIGGGSTELIVGNASELFLVESLDIGARRCTRMYFPDAAYKRSEQRQCARAIAARVQAVIASFRVYSDVSLIGTSGTIRALARLAQHQFSHHDAETLYLSDLKNMQADIIDACKQGRALEGIEEERLSTLLAGSMILIEVMSQMKFKSLAVCSSALREGIVYDQISDDKINAQHAMRSSIGVYARLFAQDEEHIARVWKTVKVLFSAYAEPLSLSNDDFRLLHAACSLHEAGRLISHKRMHLHGAYMIEHADLTGVTQNQQVMIAAIVRYHRKAKPNSSRLSPLGLDRQERAKVIVLSALLRLAAALNRSRMGEAAVPSIGFVDAAWQWCFPSDWVFEHQVCLWAAEQERVVLERLLGATICLSAQETSS